LSDSLDRDIPLRVREVHEIERVERLDAKLQPHSVLKRKRPEQREVHIPRARADEKIARCIPGRAVRGNGELRRVEILATARSSQGRASPADLLATVYFALGIDPDMEIRNHLNQPRELVKGKPVLDLWS
jgi:hypothetical protein